MPAGSAGVVKANLIRKIAASIEIGATEEIMAARTAQLAFLIMKFMAAARAPAPVFALDFTPGGVLNRRGVRQRARILVRICGHSKLLG
jgi:hypothetical protein